MTSSHSEGFVFGQDYHAVGRESQAVGSPPNQGMKLSGRGRRSCGTVRLRKPRPAAYAHALGAARPTQLRAMNPAELARLQEHYRRLPDAKIGELYAQDPAAFASKEVWNALEKEFKGRPVSPAPVSDPPLSAPVPEARKIYGLPVFILVLLVSPFIILVIYFLYLFLFWRAG